MNAFPHEQLARIEEAQLYPPFLARVVRMLNGCLGRSPPASYVATLGFRTFEHQDRLWRIHKAGGPRAAPPGLSAHNYGIGIDFARDGDLERAGLQPVWHSRDYTALGEEAKRAGLGWGGKFGDRPHVEMLGFSSAEELAPLLALWDLRRPEAENIRESWRYLDDHVDGLPV